MEKLEALSGQSYPELLDLVKQCLHNIPEKRPSSCDLLVKLHILKTEVEEKYGADMAQQVNLDKVLRLKTLEQEKEVEYHNFK